MSDLASKLARLPKEKRAQLMQKMRGASGPVEPAVTVELGPRSRGAESPASYQQEQLWFIDRLASGKAQNNVASMIELHGPLNMNALRHTLEEVIRRHEALCTCFRETDGVLQQVTARGPLLDLPVIDLAGHLPTEREGEVSRISQEEAARPFDLSKGPLFRALLFKLSDTAHLLLWVVHHIAWDAWSFTVFIREFAAIYGAYEQGQESPLPTPALQYADFALWQRESLKGHRLNQLRGFWKERLQGLEVTELDTDRPRPHVVRFEGARIQQTIESDVLERVKAIGRRQGATLFMTLLAAFKAMLYHYTRRADIVIGTPSSNRAQRGLEELIGFFVNMVPIRTQFPPEISFSQLLASVRDSALDSFSHQDLPFEKIVEAVNPPRDPARHPLFQIEFTSEVIGGGEMPAAGSLTLGHRLVHDQASRFDMSWITHETQDGLLVTVEYNQHLYNAETIGRLITSFRQVLRSVAQTPDCPVAELSVLDEESLHLLTNVWALGEQRPLVPGTLVTHFEAQSARTPHALSVTFGETALTYDELNRKANQLAHYLASKGIGPEMSVGIYMERCAEMIVAILAILKTGGAYVPIDPTYPEDRVAHILADSAVKAVVTQTHLADRIHAVRDRAVSVDGEAAVISQHAQSNPAPAASPANMAYILYTSGSTGKPKGVVIEHRSVVAFVHSIREAYGITCADRLVQFASIGFDVSVFDIFTALLTGAELCVASEEERRSPERLTDLMRRKQVTVAELPPALLPLLSPDDFPALRLLSVGGEAPAGELVAKWATPSRTFFNGYGPTETTVAVVLMQCSGHWEQTPPIGRPMANHQVLVLDERRRPVPVGVAGELYIAGVGLAREYLNQPDLTREKFVPNPYSTAFGSRLYKTGDLVRWLPDRNLEFLGRLDRQVKIRGFRVELGEIEAVLTEHPDVIQAVVEAFDISGQGKQLVAYVVGRGAEPINTAEVRQFLVGILPRYMVPARMIPLKQIPLSAHGKVDYKALPLPDDSRPDDNVGYVEPRNETEAQIATQIFGAVLGLSDRVGAEDNFFDLGGNSLQASQIVSRIRTLFKVEISLADFFREPTVAHLADMVTQGKARMEQENDKFLKALEALEGLTQPGDPVPASAAQVRLWRMFRAEPASSVANMTVLIRMKGRLDRNALAASLSTIYARHEALRTRFSEADGGHLQVHCEDAASFTLPFTDLTAVTPNPREVDVLRVAGELNRPFQMDQGGLLRARLLQLGPEDHALIMVVHHAVFDAWSGGVFFRELATSYNALVRNETPGLPDLPIQYADYAVWQKEWLASNRRQKEVAFWADYLRGVPALQLPAGATAAAYEGAFLPVSVSRELTDAIKALSAREGASLYMSLLSIYAAVLGRYLGQNLFAVGTPAAGRTRSEVENLIGMFVNTVPVRIDLSGTPTFQTLLSRVRQMAGEAFTHQELPTEALFQEVPVASEPGRAPVFQTVFALQNAPGSNVPLTGLELSAIRDENGPPIARIHDFYSPVGAKLDLSLVLGERPQGLVGVFEYNRSVLDDNAARHVVQSFTDLLEQVVLVPSRYV